MAWEDFVDPSTLYAKSYRRLQNPIAVCVALYILIYSASVLDVATVGQRLEFHEIALPLKKTT